MRIESRKWHSKNLSQNMSLRIYGDEGKPALVFPAEGGREIEFEDFGMLDVCRQFIDDGRLRICTIESIDKQSWSNTSISPADRAKRHEDYDRYVIQEVIPYLRERFGDPKIKFLTTGVSMGAYHAGNFFFKHPDVFDAVITLSGLFRLDSFIGECHDEGVYLNSPLYYLRNLTDEKLLSLYRKSKIIICAGQGAWEDRMLADAREMKDVLATKNIPAWVDIWGFDVNHDWPWWKKQLPYFLGHLLPEAAKLETDKVSTVVSRSPANRVTNQLTLPALGSLRDR